MNLAVCDTWG